MVDKKDIIEYSLVKNLLIYSILIYIIDNNNSEKNLKNILHDADLFKDEPLLYENLNSLDNDDYISNFFYCETTQMYSMVIKNDINKSVNVIFRGSSNNTHMFYNLKVKLRKIKFLENDNIKIHSGFYQQIFEGKIYQNIKKHLENLDLEDYIIYCSGHSLGGMMATLLGYFSSYVFKNNKIVIISFGSSKIGNKHFKESFDLKSNLICYRFNNNYDLVTQLPPIINYKHVGIPIDIKSNNSNKYFNLLGEHGYNSYLHNLLYDTW